MDPNMDPQFFSPILEKKLFLCKDGFPLDFFSYEKWKTSLTTSFPGPFVAFKIRDFTRHLATLHSHIRKETKHPGNEAAGLLLLYCYCIIFSDTMSVTSVLVSLIFFFHFFSLC